MLKTLFVICLLLVPWAFFAQNATSYFEKYAINGAWHGEKINIWNAMLAGEEGMTIERADAIDEKMKVFWAKIHKIHQKDISESKKIRKIYQEISTTFFRTYSNFSSLADLIEKGEFDCLTATMLYVYVFDSLGYECQAFEMPNHVYLSIRLSNGKEWLIEPTLLKDGLHTTAVQIESLRKHYQNEVIRFQTLVENEFLKSKFRNSIHNPIGLNQLVGLQFYNRALKHFNEQDYKAALRELMKANQLYHCERHEVMIELTALCLKNTRV
ncbi:MAG: hypothetical protein OHK0038_13280 [Flammeovirgaceae bacterium]